MPVQTRTDYDNAPFVLGGVPASLIDQVILQDAGRSAVLARYTVMAQDPTTLKWVPLTDIAAVDGTGLPAGIYIGEDAITAAALVAGDVSGNQILVGGAACLINEDLIVFENSLLKTSVIADRDKTIEALLREIGLFIQSVNNVDGVVTS